MLGVVPFCEEATCHVTVSFDEQLLLVVVSDCRQLTPRNAIDAHKAIWYLLYVVPMYVVPLWYVICITIHMRYKESILKREIDREFRN